MMPSFSSSARPLRGVGDFFAISAHDLVVTFKPSFTRRDRLLQMWFAGWASILLATMLTVSTLMGPLFDSGAASVSDTGAATTSVTQIGLVVTVLVVASAISMTLLSGSAEVIPGMVEGASFGMAASHLSPSRTPSLPVASMVARW